jgi:hypothetical protein
MLAQIASLEAEVSDLKARAVLSPPPPQPVSNISRQLETISVTQTTPYKVDINIRRPKQAMKHERPAHEQLLGCHDRFLMLKTNESNLRRALIRAKNGEGRLNSQVVSIDNITDRRAVSWPQRAPMLVSIYFIVKTSSDDDMLYFPDIDTLERRLKSNIDSLTRLEQAFGSALGDMLTPNEARALIKRHPEVRTY